MQMSRIKSFYVMAILILVHTVFALWVIELAYRHLAKKSEQINFVYEPDFWNPRPYVMYSLKATEWSFLGYPSQVPLSPKSKPRAFVIGGSTAHEIKATEVSKLLNDRFDVFNFSAISGVTRQDYVRLTTEIVTYKPDLVIWFSGVNDFSGIDDRPNYPHAYFIEEFNLLRATSAEKSPILAPLLLQSQIVRDLFPDIIYRSLAHQFNRDPLIPGKPNSERSAQVVVQNLLLMDHFCKSIGCVLTVIPQPILDQKKILGKLESKLIRDPEEAYPNALFKELSRSAPGLVVFNVLEPFNNSPEDIFTDRVHFRKEGYSILYQELRKLKLDQVWEKHKPRSTYPTNLNTLVEEHTYHSIR